MNYRWLETGSFLLQRLYLPNDHSQSYLDAHLMVTVIRKMVIPDKTAKGPAGRLSKLDRRTPADALATPNDPLRTE